MTCPTCKTPRERFGCAPGRCFGPASAADVVKPAAPALGRPRDPRDVGLRPLEVRCNVLAIELKRGRGGGLYWHETLSCGGEQFRWAGSATRPKKKPGKDDLCIGCTATPALPCAGGCSRVAEALERYQAPWILCREAWYCPACWELLGTMVRRGQADRVRGEEEASVDCAAACGALATEVIRYEDGWVLYRRQWFCPTCARPHVFGDGLVSR